jgi:glycine/D-amino acid oxidase-like deaminating enzyme
LKVLVVGQGYSGSLLSFQLIQRGVDVMVADLPDSSSATVVSAGILNPVTGKRIALSYRATEFLPHALDTYRRISEKTQFRVYEPKPVMQIFHSPVNRNDWFARSADPGYLDYCGEILGESDVPGSLIAPHGAILVKPAGWVDAKGLKEAVKNWLISENRYIEAEITAAQLKFDRQSVSWAGKHFDFVVFCEGYPGRNSGLFSFIPFNPSKGEIIDFRAEGLVDDYVVIHGVYIVPVSPGAFRAGATFNWDDPSPVPTPEGESELTGALEKMIRVPYRVTGHHAGIRPAIADRRPVVGFHPEFPRVAIVNGLGTKASLLAPACATMMCDLILDNIPPDPLMNVNRFSHRYRTDHRGL